MDTLKVKEHNLATGEVLEREMTAEEVEQLQADQQVQQQLEAAKAEAEQKRQAAIAKLETLGLTVDDLTALGLGV